MNFVRLFQALLLMALMLTQVSAQVPPAPVRRAPGDGRIPQIYNAQNFVVLPQIATNNVWTTQIVILNLDANSAEPYELDFYDESGTSTMVNIATSSLGPVSKISGMLSPGQTVRYTTAANSSAAEVDVWASTDNNNTGRLISAYEVIQDTIPSQHYFAETEVACDFGILNESSGGAVYNGGFMAFDNTVVGGSKTYTGIAVVNPDITKIFPGEDTILIQILDSNGNHVPISNTPPNLPPSLPASALGVSNGYRTLTLNAGQHTSFLLGNVFPETAGIQGTLYILPNSGTFTPITMFGLRSYNSGSFKSLSTINLLQPIVNTPIP